MCTSIGPDSAVVVDADAAGDSSWASRPRRLAPSTSWVAFDAAGEVEQRGRDVVADDLVVGAAEALHQRPLPGQVGRVGAGQAVAAGDVHGEQVGALGSGRRCARPGG